MKKNNISLSNCAFLFISMFMILLTVYFSQGNCFWEDDSYLSIYGQDEGYFDILFGETRHSHGGYYIGQFLCKFFMMGLPTLLSIHPVDFTVHVHSIIKGIFTVFALILISKFSIVQTKSKQIFISAFLFISSFFMYSALISGKIFSINYNFYRYFFSFIFLCAFLLYIYKFVIDRNEDNKKDFFKPILVGLCGFCIGTSIELSYSITLFFCFALITHNIMVNILSFIFKNPNIQAFKYNLNKHFYIPFVGLLTGSILSITNIGTIEIANTRGLSNIQITKDILQEYCLLFFTREFFDYYIYWLILLLIFLITFYFIYKNPPYADKIKRFLFPTFFLISILISYFLLILCGKTSYEDTFFIDIHPNIIFLYSILIILPIFLYIDNLYSNISSEINNKKYLTIVFSIIILFFSILYIYNIYIQFKTSNNTNYMQYIKQSYTARKHAYITEKIFLFYLAKNEIPIIPHSYNNEWDNYPFYMFLLDSPQKNDSNIYNINNTEVNTYMKRVYKIEKEFIYNIQENAMDLFYKNGGSFSDEELNNINFSRLKNKNFVLNNIE